MVLGMVPRVSLVNPDVALQEIGLVSSVVPLGLGSPLPSSLLRFSTLG